MTKFYPLVSILIPVYNGSDYIKEAIGSALSQSYKNIEIIVMNDGSTDNTEEIVLSYGEKIRYFKTENKGVASALNFALKQAKGEYISWLSHDDKYEIDKVKLQIEVLEAIEDKKTMLYSNWQYIDENSDVFEVVELEKKYDSKSLDIPLFPILKKDLISICSLLTHREIFEEFGGFRTDLFTTQDYDLWFNILKKYPIKHIPAVMVNTRRHRNQNSNSLRAFHQKERDELFTKILSEITDEKFDEIFGNKISYLAPFARYFYLAFMPESAIDAMIRITTFENNKKNILIISSPEYNLSQAMVEDLSSEYNLFILSIDKDMLSVSIENNVFLEIKLKSPIGFEYRNMFLQNECSLLIEKFILAFNIDLVHMTQLIHSGIAVVDVTKKYSIPMLYSVSDFPALWDEGVNTSVFRQIKLFANKFIFPKIDLNLISQADEVAFSKLINPNSEVNYKVHSLTDLSGIKENYDQLLKAEKKNNDLVIRRLLLNDLLSHQNKDMELQYQKGVELDF